MNKINAIQVSKPNTQQVFYFEMTDLYCGELNYCWLHRFKIEAKNIKGALIKLSNETGFNFRNTGVYYKAKNAHIAAYELDLTPESYWLQKAVEL